MEDVNEKQVPVADEQTEKQEYQPPALKTAEVKNEKGYATSASPLDAPQWDKGSW